MLSNTSKWQTTKTAMACFLLIISYVITMTIAFETKSLALFGALSHLLMTISLLLFYIVNQNYIAKKAKSRQMYHMWLIERFLILCCGLVFSLMACFLLVMSMLRLMEPEPIEVAIEPILQIAVLILISNLCCYLLLSSYETSSKAFTRYLLRADGLNALLVILVSFLLIRWQVSTIDEVLAFMLALTLFNQAYRILKHSLILMTEGTSEQRQLAAIQGSLYRLDAVTDIANLQLWTVVGEEMTFSCQLYITADAPIQTVEQEVLTLLKQQYAITRTAIRFVVDTSSKQLTPVT